MNLSSKAPQQTGFTVLELIVGLTVTIVISGVIFALMRDSMKVASTTYELTDTQQQLRTAQEFINRDLLNAGDALTSISNIRVPRNFVTNFLTASPVDDPATPGIINLPILSSDNDLPAGTAVLGSNPLVTVRSNPVLTDRLTVLQIDPNFTPIALLANQIDPAGSNVVISAADVGRFRVGEVYFISSSIGGTFGTITAITGTPSLVFAAGDAFGLNSPGAGGQINVISAGGTVPTSLMRVKIVHYYVNSNGLLMRRVFGVVGAGFSDSMIAENVISLQFRYFLSMRDVAGNVIQPVTQLTSSAEQLAINQAEVTVTVETPRELPNGSRQQLTMTTSTSIRNMQFRGALRPSAGG